MSEYTNNIERPYRPEQARLIYEFLRDRFPIGEDPYDRTRYFRLGSDRFAITTMRDWEKPTFGLAVQRIDYLDPSLTDAGDYSITIDSVEKIVAIGSPEDYDSPLHIELSGRYGDFEWPEISESLVPSEEEMDKLIAELSLDQEVTREEVIAEIEATALRREG